MPPASGSTPSKKYRVYIAQLLRAWSPPVISGERETDHSSSRTSRDVTQHEHEGTGWFWWRWLLGDLHDYRRSRGGVGCPSSCGHRGARGGMIYSKYMQCAIPTISNFSAIRNESFVSRYCCKSVLTLDGTYTTLLYVHTQDYRRPTTAV